MITLTLAEIAAMVDGAVRATDDSPTRAVHGPVAVDSRRVVPGGIFIAMRGEKTDGHLFASVAVEAGAALVIAERPLPLAVDQIIVTDTSAALSSLAHGVVTRVRAEGVLTVIGITGSNGKTTTKNLLREILSASGETVAPEGSFNNHVGAPLSMLAITETTRYLVVEMGASGVGHIMRLVKIATPDIAVVLKVGLAHAGEFGGIERTRLAKAEIVTDLPDTAVAILNGDDYRVASMATLTAARVRTFGLDDDLDVRADDIDVTLEGTSFTVSLDGATYPVRMRILGEHHVMNVLAALSVAAEVGIDIADAIAIVERVSRAERWRMEVLKRADGVIIINDAYNASPDSMAAALKTLAQLARLGHRSIAVLGEMAELGEYARDEHDSIGRLVVRLNVARLIAVGHGARHIQSAAGLEGSWDGESILVADADEAFDILEPMLRPGDVVLVKSSKSAGLRVLGDRLAGLADVAAGTAG